MRKRGFLVSTTVAVVGAVSLVGFQLALPGWAGFRNDPKEVVDEVWQIVNREFVDVTFNDIDWEGTRQQLLSRDYATEEDAYDAIQEALEQLNDPYTRFLDPDQFAAMQIDTSGELTGVGITLGVDEESDYLIVISPIEGSPAEQAGVKSQDLIVAIDGQETKGMDSNAAVGLIRGEPGTKVTLTILRGIDTDDETEIDFDIVRDRIELSAVNYEMREHNGQQLGYIRLNQFSGNASERMRDAITALESEGAQAYILDLRQNPGGLLHASTEIARMWLDQGAIVSTVNRQGRLDPIAANQQALTSKPLAVLVDGGSASASEILSGALQDNNRATIIGTQTFGKGLVQSVHSLSDGSGLAVTIARYRTPSGEYIDKKGITPDIVVELSDEDVERISENRDLIATLEDPQYAQAVNTLRPAIAAQAATPTSSL